MTSPARLDAFNETFVILAVLCLSALAAASQLRLRKQALPDALAPEKH